MDTKDGFIRVVVNMGSTELVDMGWSTPDENGMTHIMTKVVKRNHHGRIISSKMAEPAVSVCLKDADPIARSVFRRLSGV